MGKKRVVKKTGDEGVKGRSFRSSPKASKKKMATGTLHVESTYNNTLVLLSDKEGNTLSWSSSGSLGFKGAKKGTPFASAKVGEILGDRAITMGMKSVDVIVKGVGAGRESAIRAFSTKGIEITGIKDKTPIPHNGPRRKKPRRV